MASSFPADSFDQLGGGGGDDDLRHAAATRSLDDGDGYLGYQSQRFDSFSNLADSEFVKDSDSPFFTSKPIPETLSTPPIYAGVGGFSPDPLEFSSFSPEANGNAFDGGYVAADGSVLPPPAEMEAEEGFALREWRRLNAIRLEEKEKMEKELLSQIIAEAEDYKIDFHRRRKVTCETNRATNREKEKVFVAGQEKFHAEADKNYWKTIADLVPNEVPAIERKRGKKEQEKKPSIVVMQGPKPGKPTELSRMRQILVKLKHNTPPPLKHSPPLPAPTKDAKTGADGPPTVAAVATPIEVVAAA
ncbi:clathrin light chain 2-like [Actinidia eriantha]|uniref:clathrin light chain 2-like n=1 Tax=Actinidia eriantha TaxID=165200 RepID=UPI002589029E|nr:clathrin light chain 2-like [Actinidia eriantha]